jgi:hypothetical protein
MHSFHAFIDEAGDEGFNFRDAPKGSSEWFVMSACVLRANRAPLAGRMFHETLDPIEDARKAPAHFRKLPHEARVALIAGIARLPIRAVSVCFDKRAVANSTLISNRRLHFYAARLVLERISWIARDFHTPGHGNGKCSLTFSRCKNLSYSALGMYFEHLRAGRSNIAWEHIDTDRLKVLNHEQSVWLRAADAIASGVYQALELSNYGHCEDRFARMLRPIVYRNGTNYRSYGMKFMPRTPAPSAGTMVMERDTRYSWVSLYQ